MPDPPATEDAADESDAFADQPGMIDEGEYESPHHGFALTWTDEWTFDPAYDAPVASNVNQDFDEVHLTVTARSGSGSASTPSSSCRAIRLPTSWSVVLPGAPRPGDRPERRSGRLPHRDQCRW